MIQVKKKIAEVLDIPADSQGLYFAKENGMISVEKVEKLLAETEVEQKLIAHDNLKEVWDGFRKLFVACESLGIRPSNKSMGEAKSVLDKYYPIFTESKQN